jgi:putative transposase
MVRHTRGERAIWQRRYWEHHIRDDVDYSRHVDYCYFNPIKHELVTRISEWPYSTYHRDLRVGRIAPDFDIGRSIIDLNFE